MKRRKCPFCNKEVKFAYPYLMYLEEEKKWSFLHHCGDGLSILISADTREEVIEKWDGSDENA